MAKPNWHGRNEVKANRRKRKRKKKRGILNFGFWILNEEEDEEVAFCCDLRSMIYYLFFFGFSELGAGRSKDGLGQDVPATMKRLKKRLLRLLTSDF
jgi:hypothetical protein